MKKYRILPFILAALMVLSVSGCSGTSAGDTAGDNQNGKNAGGNNTAGEKSSDSSSARNTALPAGKNKGNSMEGVWYEQNPYGSVITISGNTIEYKSGYSDYSEESGFKTEGSGRTITIIPEDDLFAVIEIEYDKTEDMLTARTYPHTDGDGGYHLLTYARTEYTPPPEPTYGPRTDNSDPDASKSTASYDFTHLKMSFYDEGDQSHIGTDMAAQPPFADYYEYDLNVLPDGSGELSSGFCRMITVGGETVEKVKKLMEENDLASLNGLDVHTEDIPYGSQTFEFELSTASGEMIKASADYKDVPEKWTVFQKEIHALFFEAFVDAGYIPNTGDFHSTEPMKRIGREERENFGVTKSSSRIGRSDLSYDYELHADYTVFEFGEETPAALAEALTAYSSELKAAAEQDLKNDYELMEGASDSEINNASRLYAYSFRSVEYSYGDDLLYYVFESEGHANSLGIGYSKGGLYPYHRYVFDTQTGERVYMADLFNDEELLMEAVVTELLDSYGYRNREKIEDKKARELLRRSLKGDEKTDPMEFSWNDLGITFYVPQSILNNDGYEMSCTLYYEDIQDILSDKYAPVRQRQTD